MNQQENERFYIRTDDQARFQIMETSINDPNYTGVSNPGYVGIGDYDLNNFTPQHFLHLNKPKSREVWLQMTLEQVTGSNANRGLLFGGFSTGSQFNVRLWNQEENGEIQYYIDGLQIMRMFPNGNVGVGDDGTYNTANPATENLDVQYDARIRQMPPTTQNFNTVLIDVDGKLWQGPPVGSGGGADADWYDQNNLGNVPLNI